MSKFLVKRAYTNISDTHTHTTLTKNSFVRCDKTSRLMFLPKYLFLNTHIHTYTHTHTHTHTHTYTHNAHPHNLLARYTKTQAVCCSCPSSSSTAHPFTHTHTHTHTHQIHKTHKTSPVRCTKTRASRLMFLPKFLFNCTHTHTHTHTITHTNNHTHTHSHTHTYSITHTHTHHIHTHTSRNTQNPPVRCTKTRASRLMFLSAAFTFCLSSSIADCSVFISSVKA